MRVAFVNVVTVILAGLAVPASAQPGGIGLGTTSGWDLPPAAEPRAIPICEPPAPAPQRGALSAWSGMADGEPLSFQQAPAILRADHAGSVTFADFALLGDYPTVVFEREDDRASSGVDIERWVRTGRTTIGGRIVSLFRPRWPHPVWLERLRQERHGYDRPFIFWGWVVLPASRLASSPQRRPLYLRVGSSGIPASRVRQLGPGVQYASHVVNLVLPGFGDSRVTSGTYDFDLPSATQAFYRHFADIYDSIAFIPQRSQVATYGGFHRNIKNTIHGIGKPIVDQSHAYGSAGRLKSVEVFPQGQFATNKDSSHEIAHQWGDGFDWATLGNIDRSGWHPSSHTPLLYRGASLIGAVLDPSRQVVRHDLGRVRDRGHHRAPAVSPVAALSHGTAPGRAVPDVLVFADQNQPWANGGRQPSPGSAVTGRITRVTIDSIVAHHGPRHGPHPTTWRRATVVVSRDRLLSAHEMAYWNFFAQRLEDPNRTGVVSYDQYPSFDALTGHRVDLQTDIVPRAAEPITEPLEVDSPAFGNSDWPGVVFDGPVPSHFDAGTRTRLSGRVTDPDPAMDAILVRLWKHDGGTEQALRYWAPIEPNGSFAVDVEPAARETGSYSVGIFLFGPQSGPQLPRALLSPAVVR